MSVVVVVVACHTRKPNRTYMHANMAGLCMLCGMYSNVCVYMCVSAFVSSASIGKNFHYHFAPSSHTLWFLMSEMMILFVKKYFNENNERNRCYYSKKKFYSPKNFNDSFVSFISQSHAIECTLVFEYRCALEIACDTLPI